MCALPLIPLALWLAFSVAMLASGPADYASMHYWVSAPSVAVVLVLFLATALYHSLLGLQDVIVDYAVGSLPLPLLLLSKLLHAVFVAAAIFAVLKSSLA